MLNKTLIAAAIAAVFALPFAAHAAGTDKAAGSSAMKSGNGDSAGAMKRLDTDKDGSVSRDEAKKDSNLSKRFKELDKDNNGKLSATELNAAQATGAGSPPTTGATPGAGTSPGKASSAQGSATEGKKGNGGSGSK